MLRRLHKIFSAWILALVGFFNYKLHIIEWVAGIQGRRGK